MSAQLFDCLITAWRLPEKLSQKDHEIVQKNNHEIAPKIDLKIWPWNCPLIDHEIAPKLSSKLT